MVIYECIFERILAPFGGMWDDSSFVEKLMAMTAEEEILSIKNELIESFEYRGIDYLNSRNVQMTIYYYMNCAESERLDRICASNLIPLTDDVLFPALQEIYDAICRNIGPLGMVCSEFTESQEINPPHLYCCKDIIAYMSK